MTELTKIDKVLKLIIECQHPPKRKATEIVNELDFELTTKESIEILDKLVKDGYVIREIQADNTAYYFSSFEGRLFLINGGYSQSFLDIKSRNRHNKLMTIITITNIVAIIILTFLNYRATDKANDNKIQVIQLNSTITNLKKSNDSLKSVMNKDTTHKK
ncbi:MAG: hypothetical protein Q8891_16285 [Bacteroidota bacterium]|nr:hypothetical protein [Bacteroidota bacterium]